ncbi:MAG: ATP-binding protein [Dorea sp.]|nr:ATP-binding protein [Dorea sp.]
MGVVTGKRILPKRIVIYGVEGIGKSELASQFPDPLFLDVEGGTGEIECQRWFPNNVEHFRDWYDVQSGLDYVENTPHCCKTLVIDTVDWCEHLMTKAMLEKDQVPSIEKYGYGAGYKYLMEKFQKELLDRLDRIWKRCKINIVILAHAQLRKFEQPDEMGAYDRYEMKLTKTPKCDMTALVKEWADMVLFCNYKTNVVNIGEGPNKKAKAVGKGSRVIYTTHHSCWDAKNRYGLPDEMPFPRGTAFRDNLAHLFESSAPTSQATGRVNRSEEPEQQKEEQKEKPKPTEEELDIDPRIPAALRELMVRDGVNEIEIQNLTAAKGIYDPFVNVADYDPDFINNALVGKWDGFLKAIKRVRESEEIPFK